MRSYPKIHKQSVTRNFCFKIRSLRENKCCVNVHEKMEGKQESKREKKREKEKGKKEKEKIWGGEGEGRKKEMGDG